MSDDILARAHRLYELEAEHVTRLIEQDPNYADLVMGLEAMAEQTAAQGGDGRVRRMARAHQLLLEITREHAFKLGYVMAHTHPLDDAPET
jgi:hypothetical protein